MKGETGSKRHNETKLPGDENACILMGIHIHQNSSSGSLLMYVDYCMQIISVKQRVAQAISNLSYSETL